MSPAEQADYIANEKAAEEQFDSDEKKKNFGTTKSDTYTTSADDIIAKKAGMMSTNDYKILHPIKIGG